MQNRKADISDIHIVRHKSIESTYHLELHIWQDLLQEYYKSIEDIIEIKDIDKNYPAIEGRNGVLRHKWHRAVEAVLALAEDNYFNQKKVLVNIYWL